MKKTKLEKFVRQWIVLTPALAVVGVITSVLILFIVFVDLSNGQPINWALILRFSSPFIICLIATAFYAIFSIFSIFKEEE